MNHIAFRVPEGIFKRLEELAYGTQLNPNTVARRLLLERLGQVDGSDEILAVLQRIEEKLDRLGGQ